MIFFLSSPFPVNLRTVLSNNSVMIIYGIKKLWPETVGPVSGTEKHRRAAAKRVRWVGWARRLDAGLTGHSLGGCQEPWQGSLGEVQALVIFQKCSPWSMGRELQYAAFARVRG